MCGIKKSESDWQSNEVWITEMNCAGDNVHPLAPSGGKALSAPYGGNQSHPLRGGFFTSSAPGVHYGEGGAGYHQSVGTRRFNSSNQFCTTTMPGDEEPSPGPSPSLIIRKRLPSGETS